MSNDLIAQALTYGVDLATNGNKRSVRSTRDGALFTADWRLAGIMDGRAYMMNVGAFSTPITGGGAGTILDQDQPEGIISVPSGKAIVPVRIHVQCQAPLSVTDNDESEILIAVDRAAAWAGDGTVTTETALNMRTDNPRSSSCSCASAATANITNPTLGIELAHSVMVADVQGTAATVVVTKHELLYEPSVPPIIVGPAAIYLYWGGTVATSGFAQAVWLEYDDEAFV